MKLVSFGGLNCYLSCVMTLAGAYRLPYMTACFNLWSETDFFYDARFDVFFTRRLQENLRAWGMTMEKHLNVVPEQAKQSIQALPAGAVFIMGIDAFTLPWSPIFHLSHDGHFCIVQKQGEGDFLCVDPSYGKAREALAQSAIMEHARQLEFVRWVKPDLPQVDTKAEAEAALRCLPRLSARLCRELKTGENLLALGRYADALISNRRLYNAYAASACKDAVAQPFFDAAHLARWSVVKNGLLKASLLRNNHKILSEVTSVLHEVIARELVLAARSM